MSKVGESILRGASEALNYAKGSKPFKTVTVEYFEELKSSVEVSQQITPSISNSMESSVEVAQRRIRVVTTTRIYNLGSSRGEPNVTTTYEYL